MSAEKTEPTGTGTGERRRGTRGGRGRKRAGEASSSTSLADPRIAGRRPSRAAATKEPEEPAKEAPKARAPRRRRASAASAPAKSEAATSEAAEATSEVAEATSEVTPKPATTRRRGGAANSGAATDGVALAEEVRALREAIEEQSRALTSLSETHERTSRRLRLGVFVDVPNLIYGAERGEGVEDGSVVHMGKLLAYLSDGRELIRATAYSPVSDDPGEPVEQQRFVMPFVRHEYRIVTKPMKRFADGSVKGNFDVEMALDMVTMADRLDVVSIVSGDADFARAVELLQGKGVRVEVVAFSGSTSIEMRALADHYIDVGGIMDRVGA